MTRRLHPALRHPRQWYSQRRQPRGAILMYHSVGAVGVDPWGLFVTPSRFGDHLRSLYESFSPMRLRDLARAQEAASLPDRAVAVTFDDGYVNNLREALPLLERHEIPATVFVISGAVDTDREFWWDELEQMLTGPERLDGEVRLSGPSGPTRRFRVETRRRGRPLGPKASRMDLYYRLWEHLSAMTRDERDDALTTISTWSGWTPRARMSHRPLHSDELRELAGHPLIDIGAHTRNHPLLPQLPPEEQLTEMVESTNDLEAVLGHPIDTFSYPFGAHDDVTVDAARTVGFRAACTTRGRSVTIDSTVLRLPRMDVKNWSGREFRARMELWRAVQ